MTDKEKAQLFEECKANGTLYTAPAVDGKGEWRIAPYVTKGGDFACEIVSPHGHEGFCFCPPDGRISKHGLDANLEFGSMTLTLSESLLGHIAAAYNGWLAKHQGQEEFADWQV
jgi:hypothetical protein